MDCRRFSLLILLLLSVVACNRDPESLKKKYVETGNKYFDQGKYKEASILYRKALSKDMRFGEAYYRLGLTELKLNRVPDAVKALRRAVELQPDNLEAAAQLADIYLLSYFGNPRREEWLTNELTELANHIEQKDPESYQNLRLQGYLAMDRREYKAAEERLRAANKLKPYQPDVILALVQVLTATNRFEEGEALGKELIGREKSYAPMYELLTAEYFRRQREADAEAMMRLKIENNPANPQFRVQLAQYYQVRNREAEMLRTLETLIENSKDFPRGYALVGDFFYRLQQHERAHSYFEKGLTSGPQGDKRLYRKKLVETKLAMGQIEEASRELDQLITEDPKDGETRAIRAAVSLQGGDPQKLQAAIDDMQQALQQLPQNFVLRNNLGRAYAARGDVDAARVQLAEAIKLRPDYLAPRITLAQLELGRGEYGKALQLAGEVLAYDPGNTTAKMIRASALAGSGDMRQARSELERAVQADPKSPNARYQLGVLAFKEGKHQEAERIFQELRKAYPSDMRPLIGLAETHVGSGRMDAALKLLTESVQEAPENSLLRLALANTAVRAEKYDLAVAEFERILAKEPNRADVQLRLAETHRRNGKLDRALQAFQKATEVSPDNAMAQFQLGMMLELLGRQSEAKPVYERVLKLQPEHAFALNNLAYILAEEGSDLDQALTMATKARQLMPQDANVADTLGWIYIKKNLSDSAIQIFREAVTKHPERAIFRYHLAMALAQKGDKPQAKKELETALRNNPNKDEETKIRKLLADLG